MSEGHALGSSLNEARIGRDDLAVAGRRVLKSRPDRKRDEWDDLTMSGNSTMRQKQDRMQVGSKSMRQNKDRQDAG